MFQCIFSYLSTSAQLRRRQMLKLNPVLLSANQIEA